MLSVVQYVAIHGLKVSSKSPGDTQHETYIMTPQKSNYCIRRRWITERTHPDLACKVQSFAWRHSSSSRSWPWGSVRHRAQGMCTLRGTHLEVPFCTTDLLVHRVRILQASPANFWKAGIALHQSSTGLEPGPIWDFCSLSLQQQ